MPSKTQRNQLHYSLLRRPCSVPFVGLSWFAFGHVSVKGQRICRVSTAVEGPSTRALGLVKTRRAGQTNACEQAKGLLRFFSGFEGALLI